MTLKDLVRKLNPHQKALVFSMGRDGEERELFFGKIGDCPHRYGKFEVATIETDLDMDDYPMRHSLHSILVIILDEVPESF